MAHLEMTVDELRRTVDEKINNTHQGKTSNGKAYSHTYYNNERKKKEDRKHHILQIFPDVESPASCRPGDARRRISFPKFFGNAHPMVFCPDKQLRALFTLKIGSVESRHTQPIEHQ